DADALNLLAGWAGGEPLAGGSPAAVEPLYPLLPPESILTPHGGELDRLLQATGADSAEQLALTLQATILAKGPQTVVYPHESGRSSYRYTDGTPALAKAGTGDVLAGIIAALLAQGATAWQAAVSGVQLHGRAGLLAEMNGSRRSLIARDIIDGLPHALREIEGI
ncbi:MAG: NAD(P)H-hydrate dehydratase, partial [Coriobacteriia bacterium]|nr:NAD(P)H-hydrate dehydratase [Coriobacteriia bacterium]